MPFDSQVVQLSPADLDKFFEATPSSTPTADTLVVGKDPIPNTTVVEPNNATPPIVQKVGTGLDNIPFYDDSLDAPTVAEPIVDDKATKEPAVAEPIATKKDPVEKTDPEKVEPIEVDTKGIDEVLTNTVEYLIKSGKWVDFEGREDLQITQETYADLAAKQDEYRVSQMFNELLDSTGDYGKAIITHVKNGGNPDEIIDLFKEQKQLQQIDTSTEVGKQAKIEKYYSDILGWKPEKVERTIKRLITDNEIESEFQDVNDLYDKHFKDELAKTQEQAKQQELENKQRQIAFVTNIKTVLKEDTTLTEADRRLVAGSILDFKHKLPNGQKVNDFYIKFAELQADPKQYVEFVRFVMDKENYKKAIQRTEKTNASKEVFNFIKNGAALSKTTTQPIEINSNPEKATRGTDFSFALKK